MASEVYPEWERKNPNDAENPREDVNIQSDMDLHRR